MVREVNKKIIALTMLLSCLQLIAEPRASATSKTEESSWFTPSWPEFQPIDYLASTAVAWIAATRLFPVQMEVVNKAVYDFTLATVFRVGLAVMLGVYKCCPSRGF